MFVPGTNDLRSSDVIAEFVELTNGNVVAVWQHRNPFQGYPIFARVFDGDGVPISGDILVNEPIVVERGTYGAHLEDARILATVDGGFSVAWNKFESPNQDGRYTATAIFRKFGADGDALTDEAILGDGSRALAVDGLGYVQTFSEPVAGDTLEPRLELFANVLGADGSVIMADIDLSKPTGSYAPAYATGAVSFEKGPDGYLNRAGFAGGWLM